MNASERMFVTLLRCALLGQVPPSAEGVDWRAIYETARQSRVLYCVCEAILRMPPEHRPDETVMGWFHAGSDLELYSQVMQSYAFPKVLEALSRAGVRVCPVKGCVLRKHYPSEAMRTMEDADIFIHPQDKYKAKETMLEAGYAFAGDNGTHMVFEKPPMIAVELHENPLSEYSNKRDALRGLWNMLVPMGENRFEMPPGLHYIYMLLHLDKHMNESGFGPRALMDFLIVRKTFGDFLQNEDVCEHLRDNDLYSLAKSIRHIEGAWFDGEDLPECLADAEDWIVHGGVYGSEEQQVIRFLELVDGLDDRASNGQFGLRYIVRRVFLPMSQLRLTYRELYKYPFMYPVCLVKRWFELLNKRALVRRRIATLERITPEQIEKQNHAIKELYHDEGG